MSPLSRKEAEIAVANLVGTDPSDIVQAVTIAKTKKGEYLYGCGGMRVSDIPLFLAIALANALQEPLERIEEL